MARRVSSPCLCLCRPWEPTSFSAKRWLLARHQAPMRAVALSLLGYGPDADDAVQDAALTALRRIGDARDRAAVGAWLRAVVRHAARTRLRATREMPGPDGLDHLHLHVPGRELPHPEQAIELHAMRDWIWGAVEQLPPELRLVLMLRHFPGITSYQETAAACEVPVGTVRGRLNQARGGQAVSTGCAYDNHFVSVITIKDRKITHWRDCLDPAAVFDAIGRPAHPE
ncbi:sigma-70 family RNA polymerase sigma factor [Streptomyces sp. NPDC094472]|uniref:sigma-70 family RNA polymerase sigma factor n=1 Tax=Streptomyces sp. NPDC094472 TaxID=3155080 RepID=UPI0033168F71